jgi:hypothetical protein
VVQGQRPLGEPRTQETPPTHQRNEHLSVFCHYSAPLGGLVRCRPTQEWQTAPRSPVTHSHESLEKSI